MTDNTSRAEPCSFPPGTPKFPADNPEDALYAHACMGLNACKNLGRTQDNDCAGQGYCSTTPDHTCHVTNACRHQGGCGLYGTAEELANPGANDCRYQGSCATPINAERFSTTAPEHPGARIAYNRGKSVWVRARAVFERNWASMEVNDTGAPGTKPSWAPEKLGKTPEPFEKTGPTMAWIEDYSGEGMTACGSSGLSGAGSCV